MRLDLTDERFGLLVAKRIDHRSNGRVYWECKCDCGNYAVVSANKLRSGWTKSCGCLRTKVVPNEYDLSGRYAVMIFDDGTECIFNKKYYNVVRKKHWFKDRSNHVACTINGKTVGIGRFLYEEAYFVRILDDYVVDHKNRDPLDNRICNLRVCYPEENARNRTISKNNTSGVTGVYHVDGKWAAKICFEKQLIHLGTFETKEEAIRARKKAERKYFGEYAPK